MTMRSSPDSLAARVFPKKEDQELNPDSSHQETEPRILLFSHRNIFEPLVWRCHFQEFERIIEEVDSVDLVAPQAKTWYVNGKRVALRLGEFANIPLNPGVSTINLDRDYDLFFTVCFGASDLLHLTALKGPKRIPEKVAF